MGSATSTVRAGRRRRSVSRQSTARSSRAAPPPVTPAVGLRADADRQMRRPGKRPDVAGRIGRQLDDDLVAGDAVREEPGRDRELIAAERASRRGAAPGCSRRRRRSRIAARRTPRVVSSVAPPASTVTSVTRDGPSTAPARTRGGQQRRIERWRDRPPAARCRRSRRDPRAPPPRIGVRRIDEPGRADDATPGRPPRRRRRPPAPAPGR